MNKVFESHVNRRAFLGTSAGAALAASGITAGANASAQRITTARYQDANLPTPREETVVIEQSPNNVWDSFNPFIPNGEAYNYGLAIVCREYMFYYNLLSGETTPWLATEYSYNDDFTQCTLSLNPDVTWSDGEPFTAEDVVFTQQLLLDNPQLSGAAGTIRDVASVTATDEHTVTWELNESTPRFHYRFLAGVIADGLRVMPKHIWEGEDPGSFRFNPPIQTGAYVLRESSATKLYYLWEKNENYWNKANFDPVPQYVLYRQGGGVDVAVSEFLAGNVDSAGEIDFLNQEVVASQYDQTARFNFPDPNPRAFFFNVDSPSGLFATPEGRWAMSHLIDRETIGTTIWQPSSRPAESPWADYEGWKKWQPEEVLGQFDLTYNVDKANELLDQLGATERDGDGIRILNGNPLKLNMITPAPTSALEYQIGVSFAATAKEAGIDIALKSLPGSAFGDTFLPGDYDISCHWVDGMSFDPLQTYDAFHSRNYVPIGERATEGDGSATRLQSPELDALIEQLEEIDPEDEANLPVFNDALTVFMEELPMVASIQTIYPFMFNTAYWEGWPTDEDPYAIPANWWGQFLFALGNLRPAGSE